MKDLILGIIISIGVFIIILISYHVGYSEGYTDKELECIKNPVIEVCLRDHVISTNKKKSSTDFDDIDLIR